MSSPLYVGVWNYDDDDDDDDDDGDDDDDDDENEDDDDWNRLRTTNLKITNCNVSLWNIFWIGAFMCIFSLYERRQTFACYFNHATIVSLGILRVYVLYFRENTS